MTFGLAFPKTFPETFSETLTKAFPVSQFPVQDLQDNHFRKNANIYLLQGYQRISFNHFSANNKPFQANVLFLYLPIISITSGFLTFSGGIEIKLWLETG